jgi:hypothetical protein
MIKTKNAEMHQASETNIILMRENALLPANLSFHCEPFIPGWKLVKNMDCYSFSRRIREQNWSFVRLEGHKIWVLGLASQGTLRRGITRILMKLRARRFNSLEISVIVSRRFLGIMQLGIFVKLRHVQENSMST